MNIQSRNFTTSTAKKQSWTKPTLTNLALGDAEATKQTDNVEHVNMNTGVVHGPTS